MATNQVMGEKAGFCLSTCSQATLSRLQGLPDVVAPDLEHGLYSRRPTLSYDSGTGPKGNRDVLPAPAPHVD